jgi:hypothetical protein
MRPSDAATIKILTDAHVEQLRGRRLPSVPAKRLPRRN